MKKLIIGSILSILAFNSFAAPKQEGTYNKLLKSTKIEEVLKDSINNSFNITMMIGKLRCAKVNKYGKITENATVAHLQVSCSNLTEDFHVVMAKRTNSIPVVDLCKDAAKKFKGNAKCRGKLK